MAIIVRHGSGTGIEAVGAFGSGQGKRQAEDTRQATAQIASAAESRKQRQHATRQAEDQREFTLGRDKIGRKFTTERDEASRAFTIGRDETRRNWQTEDIAQGREWQREDEDRRREGRRDDIEWGYTARQRAEWDQINAQIEAVQNDETLTDEEKEAGVRQLRDKQQGIQRQPKMPDDGPSPQEQFEQSTFTSEDGVIYGQDRSGAWRVIRDPQQGEQQRQQRDQQQRQRDMDAARKRLEARDAVRSWEERPATAQEIHAEVQRQRQLEEEYAALEEGGSGQAGGERDPISEILEMNPRDPKYVETVDAIAEREGKSPAEIVRWLNEKRRERGLQ